MTISFSAAEHAQYVRSPAWRKRARRYLFAVGAYCRACGRAQDIEVHHVNYERWGTGAELDADLQALCDVHHEMAHDYERSGDFGPMFHGDTLERATAQMIRDVQARRAGLAAAVEREPNGEAAWLLVSLALALVGAVIAGLALAPFSAGVGWLAGIAVFCVMFAVLENRRRR